MKNIAVVLSGGVGSRFNSDIPKQYTKVLGKTILEHTITQFDNAQDIHEIYVVAHINYHNLVKDISSKFSKFKGVIESGSNRSLSSWNFISYYNSINKEECNILIHDAVRPLISTEVINNCTKQLKSSKAVAVGTPATDTVVSYNNLNNTMCEPLLRETLYYMQTPQCFRLSLITEAYKKALEDISFIATDDCSVVKKYIPKQEILLIEGSSSNIKITYNEDITTLKSFLTTFSQK